MKPKSTQANISLACQTGVCANCSNCDSFSAENTKPAKAESKALYNSEVLTYYFYFYHQLVTGKNGYGTTAGEWQ